MKIILGSQSLGRQRILDRMGYRFEVMPSNIDEKSIRHDDPKVLTMTLAHAKADVLLPRIMEPSILITSDQVVSWNGTIREKPIHIDEARAFLKSYTEYPAETITAVVTVNTETRKRFEGLDVAKVWFREIPENIIDQVIADGFVFRQAGGFSIEHPLLKNYVAQVEGEIESVIGLPKDLTERLIAACSKRNDY